jgi:hypothetical protein
MSWMIENADAYRLTAQQRRNRGLHTGKAAKGWNAKPRLDDCPWARGRVDWHLSKSAALEIYERAVFPERFWSGVGVAPTMDDVIRMNEQAARDALLATF